MFKAGRLLREWVMSLTLAVSVGLLSGFCYLNRDTAPSPTLQPTPVAFAPVSTNGLTFLTPGPYVVGQEVTLKNGVCNNSDVNVQTTIIAGFEEQGVDKLLSRNVLLIPPPDPYGGANITPLPRPLPPGCQGVEPITGSLPSNLLPGKWVLYLSLNVTGASPGQTQRLTVTSAPFEVIADASP